MWVDMDDLKADLERTRREIEEEFDEETDWYVRSVLAGMLMGYGRVEIMLDEVEENYRNQGLEHIRSLREEQKSEE